MKRSPASDRGPWRQADDGGNDNKRTNNGGKNVTADASAGLTGSAAGLTEQAASQGGAAEHVAAPEPAARPRVYQTWARLNGNWICVMAAPDRDAAIVGDVLQDDVALTAVGLPLRSVPMANATRSSRVRLEVPVHIRYVKKDIRRSVVACDPTEAPHVEPDFNRALEPCVVHRRRLSLCCLLDARALAAPPFIGLE